MVNSTFRRNKGKEDETTLRLLKIGQIDVILKKVGQIKILMGRCREGWNTEWFSLHLIFVSEVWDFQKLK